MIEVDDVQSLGLKLTNKTKIDGEHQPSLACQCHDAGIGKSRSNKRWCVNHLNTRNMTLDECLNLLRQRRGDLLFGGCLTNQIRTFRQNARSHDHALKGGHDLFQQSKILPIELLRAFVFRDGFQTPPAHP